MYFVEDNAADAHDSQVKDCFAAEGRHSFPARVALTAQYPMFAQSLHGETEAPSFSWTYEEIKEVHKRWWQLRDNAVEIFLTNGRTLLLAFDNTKVG